MLQKLDAYLIKGGGDKGREKVRSEIVNKFALKTEEDEKRDRIAHYVLRLAYCRPNDRNWFLNLEVQLFKLRLQEVDINAFLKDNQLSYTQVHTRLFVFEMTDCQLIV